ncbi:UDP-N-acetylglucosamine transferase subunit ALG13 [Periplaneta americana]|uniref:UDP-N-acetylglucosamine transferase subunit ALG13 n=1 Tax=Periplaneta americana TaxID=6978 RepID=UPI0037E94B3E
MASGHVFATVGTTKFDLFISTLSCQNILHTLSEKGYNKLTMQIGHGTEVPCTGLIHGVDVDYFRFKDSIADDIQKADLIISHAGAGSCLEALGAGKPLLVVINEDLMDNHQIELAQQLHSDGYLLYTNCANLEQTLRDMNVSTLKPFPQADPYKFTDYLEKMFGFDHQM